MIRFVLGVSGRPDRSPALVVEAGGGPARLLETRVVGLTVIDLGHQDRAGARLPPRVARDELLAPVLVRDSDLHQKAETLAVDIPASFPGQVPAVPAVAELHSDRVGSGLQERRDVVGLVLEALVVARPSRREELIADAPTVQVHLVEAVARHIGSGLRDRARELELAPQHRRRPALRHVFRQARLDPARLPVRGLEEPHLPGGRRAPGRGATAPVPNAHLPVVPRSGPQRGAFVDTLDGLVRRHLARVPYDFARTAPDTRDTDLVGRLADAPRLGLDPPAEARLSGVDSKRVLLVLGSQSRHSQRPRGTRRHRRSCGNQEQRESGARHARARPGSRSCRRHLEAPLETGRCGPRLR